MNAIVSRLALAAGLALVAAMAARAGWASTVILVRPANPKAITAEALVRMHGELVSAGFDVQITATTAGADPRRLQPGFLKMVRETGVTEYEYANDNDWHGRAKTPAAAK